jgi:DNA-binding response OmpR family regulator
MESEPIWDVMLIVGDDDDARTHLAATFRARGYDAIAATSATAVSLARQARPGLIVLDLPPTQALATATALRDLPSFEHAFIVAITPEDLGIGEGVIDEFVYKPSDLTALAISISDRLRRN